MPVWRGFLSGKGFLEKKKKRESDIFKVNFAGQQCKASTYFEGFLKDQKLDLNKARITPLLPLKSSFQAVSLLMLKNKRRLDGKNFAPDAVSQLVRAERLETVF